MLMEITKNDLLSFASLFGIKSDFFFLKKL